MTGFQTVEIGRIHSPFKKRFGTPRQGVLTPSTKAFVEVHAAYRAGLGGLEEFSHLWLISFLDRSEPISKLKVRPPRLRGKKRGLFSTRGPHRPNPLGLSAVKLEKVEPKGLWVSGVDLLDQTPILDIKPYISFYDSIDSFEPEWISQTPQVEVLFTERFKNSLDQIDLEQGLSKEEFCLWIEECLKFDPRPIPYLKRESETYFLSLGPLEVETLSRGAVFEVLSVTAKTEPKL